MNKKAGKVLKIVAISGIMSVFMWKSMLILKHLHKKICENYSMEDLRTKKFQPVNIGVVLQVYKRNSLKLQLEAVANQTLLPTTVIVLQNGYYVDVSQIITEFRKTHPHMEIEHIASSKNLRYHGRFYMAYMMKETYVSVWDDDMFPKSQWLQYCVDQSKLYGNALVTANGLTFIRIHENEIPHTKFYEGLNDFGGHTWTLPKQFLKYYLEMEMPTLFTGEDILLSYALQQKGIITWKPPYKEDERIAIHDYKTFGDDENASWRRDQSPRWYLFCKLLKMGFKTLTCENCSDERVLNACLVLFEKQAKVAEDEAEIEDSKDNNRVVWSAPTSK